MIFKRKSFDQTFSKVCGFSRQSLESRSAERETLSALQAGGAPVDRLEGAKIGRIFDFVCIIARCANGCRLRRMVIRFAERLFAYGKMKVKFRALRLGNFLFY